MATLYVENVPDEVYESLRKRAQKERRSISAEVIRLLEDKFPTAEELKRRREIFSKIDRLQFTRSENAETLPDSTEMIREDRER